MVVFCLMSVCGRRRERKMVLRETRILDTLLFVRGNNKLFIKG